jgi:N-acetylglutamate synthase-like GNAT family acetyltransferase
MPSDAEPALRPATRADVPAIVALLEAARLPAAELEDHLENFVVAEADGRIVGCGGLETYDGASAGLVRSMAVEQPLRRGGLGARMLAWVTARAAALGLTELFLFTVNARDFYLRHGFRDATLNEFPEALRRSAQYRAAQRFGEQWGVVAMRR